MTIAYKTRQGWCLDVSDGLRATQDIPGLKQDVAKSRVYGSIDAIAAACSRLGLDSPDEDWLGGLPERNGLLKEYQREGVDVLLHNLRTEGGALLCDEQGLGKTRTAIATAQHLLGEKQRVLIIAHSRWGFAEELKRYLNLDPTQVAVLGPTSSGYRKEWEKAPAARWVITSAEMAPKVFPKAFSTSYPALLVLDEAHKWRDPKGPQQRLLKDLRAVVPFRLAMTGTPADKNKHYWQLMDLVLPGRFGSFHAFSKVYCNGHMDEQNHWDADGSSNEEELKLRLSYYMVRREQKDVLTELPAMTLNPVWVDPDGSARAGLQKAMAKAIPFAKGLESALKCKMPEAVRRAADARRFLLLTWRKDHAEQMWEQLKGLGLNPQLIHGEVPEPERIKRIAFCEANGEGLVATGDSVGTGLNLQKVASYGILHALSYVPADMLQRLKRLHRMGQTEPVRWDILAARGSADVLVIRKVLPKIEAQLKVLGGSAGKELASALEETSEDALKTIYAEMQAAAENGEDELLWLNE